MPPTVQVQFPKGLRPKQIASTPISEPAKQSVPVRTIPNGELTGEVQAPRHDLGKAPTGLEPLEHADPVEERSSKAAPRVDQSTCPAHDAIRVEPAPVAEATIVDVTAITKQLAVRGQTKPVSHQTDGEAEAAELENFAAQVHPSRAPVDVLPAQTERRRPRLTIGRIDLNVHVQPPVPPAAPAAPPKKPETAQGLEVHYLDRFDLLT